jgi:preprotein translocase subunit SecB
MTENPNGANGEGAPQAAGQEPPRVALLTQYVKDLSFENPRAPLGLQQGDVRAAQLGDGQFEVVIELNADAKSGENQVFLVELTYGGLFALANIPLETVQQLLLIQCPTLLFPFARRVIADATRDGGFMPLIIDPIDFTALFRRKMQTAQETEQA